VNAERHGQAFGIQPTFIDEDGAQTAVITRALDFQRLLQLFTGD